MGVSLVKGQKVNVFDNTSSVTKIIVGLGWSPNAQESRHPFDLDASAFLLNSTGKLARDEDFIFYNNPVGAGGAVGHTGNNTTGMYSGDAEQIRIDLANVPKNIEKIAIAITINEAIERNQIFGMIKKAYVRIINEDSNEELIKFDLSNQFTNETAVVAAELYRYNNTWKFNATGAGFHGGLAALCRNFGIIMDIDSNTNQSNNRGNQDNSGFSGQQNSNNSFNNQQQNNISVPNYNNVPNNQYVNHNQGAGVDRGLDCPQCGSNRVTGGKKGFRLGRAAVGTILLGPVGFLGGFIGSNNLEFACLSCNFKWTAQSNGNTMNWINEQANNAKNVVNKYINGDFVDSVIAACAIVSIADGYMAPEEKAKLLDYFRSSTEFRSVNIGQVEQKFNNYIQRIQFDKLVGKAEALRVVGKQRTKPDAARLIVRLCCAIAYADGDFGLDEKKAIEEICAELNLNKQEFIS